MSKKYKELLFNLTLVLLSLIVCFVTLEWYLGNRYAAEHALLFTKYADRELCTAASQVPELIYTYIPGQCGTNSQGYFDDEHAFEKDDSSFRIVIIGDSVAQGQGVQRGQSFGKVLEQKLRRSDPALNVEVIILARSGYSTSQELHILHSEAFNYHPDLIIWSYVLNDPAHPIFHNANGELGKYFYAPESHLLHLVNRSLFRLKEKINGWTCDKDFHQWLHCVYDGQVGRSIQAIGEQSRKRGVPVLFTVHPVFEEDNDFENYTFKTLHEELSRMASAEDLVYIDILSKYQKYDPRLLNQSGYSDGWFDVWHPNVLGHRLVADTLFGYISGTQLASSRGTGMPQRPVKTPE